MLFPVISQDGKSKWEFNESSFASQGKRDLSTDIVKEVKSLLKEFLLRPRVLRFTSLGVEGADGGKKTRSSLSLSSSSSNLRGDKLSSCGPTSCTFDPNHFILSLCLLDDDDDTTPPLWLLLLWLLSKLWLLGPPYDEVCTWGDAPTPPPV